jgi:hypothetical protein
MFVRNPKRLQWASDRCDSGEKFPPLSNQLARPQTQKGHKEEQIPEPVGASIQKVVAKGVLESDDSRPVEDLQEHWCLVRLHQPPAASPALLTTPARGELIVCERLQEDIGVGTEKNRRHCNQLPVRC